MNDEFVINRQGKSYILFQGLLDEAHRRGLKGIDTELLQAPSEENGNVAIARAAVTMLSINPDTGEVRTHPETGEPIVGTYSGIGDASPENVGRNIAAHSIRMAETRAKARALRDAVNAGGLVFEELTDADGEAPGGSSGQQQAPRRQAQNRQQRPTPVPDPPSDEQAAGEARGNQNTSGGGRRTKARKSQIDLLRTLAEELRGENGVARLEQRIGKALSELSRQEADEWIDRLTPADNGETASGG